MRAVNTCRQACGLHSSTPDDTNQHNRAGRNMGNVRTRCSNARDTMKEIIHVDPTTVSTLLLFKSHNSGRNIV
jgi:hypothetical protein